MNGLWGIAGVVAVLVIVGIAIFLISAKSAQGGRIEPLPAEIETQVREAFSSRALPRATLTAQPGVYPRSPLDSRLGGPVTLGADEPWPLDRKGRAMLFLAQVNFAEMPKLQDYPETGVLQVFISTDEFSGADFSDPRRSDFKVIWRPLWEGQGLERPQMADKKEIGPFRSEDMARRGARLAFDADADMMTPPSDSPELAQILDPLLEASSAALELLVDELNDQNGEPTHHVGGHPVFTQTDFRSISPELAAYDRVLLQVSSDEVVMWGDAGEAQFMIRRDDLLARDFSRVAFNWDCY